MVDDIYSEFELEELLSLNKYRIEWEKITDPPTVEEIKRWFAVFCLHKPEIITGVEEHVICDVCGGERYKSHYIQINPHCHNIYICNSCLIKLRKLKI